MVYVRMSNVILHYNQHGAYCRGYSIKYVRACRDSVLMTVVHSPRRVGNLRRYSHMGWVSEAK